MNPSLILTNEESDVTELREVGQEPEIIAETCLVLTEERDDVSCSSWLPGLTHPKNAGVIKILLFLLPRV